MALETRMASSAVTYLTSCWSDWSKPIPERSVTACTAHRVAEMEALKPELVVTVGDDACRFFLGKGVEEYGGGAWQHHQGYLVLPLSEDFDAAEVVALATALDRTETVHELD